MTADAVAADAQLRAAEVQEMAAREATRRALNHTSRFSGGTRALMERGREHIDQEGTSFWQRLREIRGWSRDDVYERTTSDLSRPPAQRHWGVPIPPPEQELYEDYPGWPGLDAITSLAELYETTPGGLLDAAALFEGRRLDD